MIDGQTRLLGLIGNPVEHTLSPVIHNNLAPANHINAVYVPFHVADGNLRAAVLGAYALNVLGLNVTVPYKTDVVDSLVDIDPLAKKIGAVNTLVRTEGGYKGYNTDMPGLYRAMECDGVKLSEHPVLILGAGGVARAVAIMLADKGVEEAYILNRSVEKAQAVAQEANAFAGRPFLKAMAISEWEQLPCDRKYLAIQATSVGMHPHVEEAIIEEEAFYRLLSVGYDIVFNPFETKFMRLCAKAGAESYNGLKMLLYQGVIAFELWTGETITDSLACEVYKKMLEAISQK